MSVRSKFKVSQVSDLNEDGSKSVVLYAVYGDGKTENAEYWKLTPSGQIRMSTINEKAWSQFEIGKEYYVDFTRAE